MRVALLFHHSAAVKFIIDNRAYRVEQLKAVFRKLHVPHLLFAASIFYLFFHIACTFYAFDFLQN